MRPVSEIVTSRLHPVVVRALRANTIRDPGGNLPYMSRYYLLGRPRKMPDGSSPFDEFGAPKPNAPVRNCPSVVVHRIHRSDSAEFLHNHPWRWALSVVLVGGYREYRVRGDGVAVECRDRRRFTINFIRAGQFHRIELIDAETWTFVIRGRRFREWAYRSASGGDTILWRGYLDATRSKSDGEAQI